VLVSDDVRTTLDLDERLLKTARSISALEGSSMGRVVSRLALAELDRRSAQDISRQDDGRIIFRSPAGVTISEDVIYEALADV